MTIVTGIIVSRVAAEIVGPLARASVKLRMEWLALLDETRRALPRVRVPALLIHARHDKLVPLDSMQRIYDALGSDDKRTLTLERSGHVVSEDVDCRLVFEAAAEFIAAHL